MPIKPTANEQEYFARQETERKCKIAEERQAQLKAEEREADRVLHFMRCPKCGLPLKEIVVGDVRVDKCLGCEGIWLDKGELEALHSTELGFLARIFSVFRR